MLEKLNEVLIQLPVMLEKRELWDSLIINRRKPYTYRVFTNLPDGFRVCLHKFDVCDDREAFVHPHPWSGAFAILSGAYKMTIGRSVDRTSPPLDVMTEILMPYSMYEITNPLTWHSVIPLSTTYSVMVNGPPWDAETAHTEVRTTKGKDLDKMPEDELLDHLRIFKKLLYPDPYSFWNRQFNMLMGAK